MSLVSPALALDASQLGLSLPGIQGAGLSDQAANRAAGAMVLESPIDEQGYRLGPGDTLAIHLIIGESELYVDHNLMIGADGKIFFPNIGAISLSGLSLAQAKEKIDRQIRQVYKEQYKLYVMLGSPKTVKIYITGMVKNPGPLAVYDNLRVSEVLGQAGGITSGASNRYIYIKRKNIEGDEELLKADLFAAFRSKDLSKDIRIQAGDVIEVPDANGDRISQLKDDNGNDRLLFGGRETFIYVYGEVARGGRFEYVPGKKLSDYLSLSGGPTVKANLSGVTLTRQENNQPKVYNVNVSDILQRGMSSKDIEVLAGDVIYVPGNFFYMTDFTSVLNTILITLTLYTTIARK
ncbi:MAG: SLBB domain-containing protein [Candidatus Margulisbacteria bacterium]|nr:SLBB domain-containing protein [Candidatus Margulisiibacteriota bacterium]